MTGPLVSLFTPTHRPTYLGEVWATIAAQTYAHWEWLIVLNNGAEVPSELVGAFAADPRVRVLDAGVHTGGVGNMKHFACRMAEGEILFELDHDDLLLGTALERTVEAFAANPGASLVYSDFAQIDADGSANYDRWNPAMGWIYEPIAYDPPLEVAGHVYRELLKPVSLQPTPHNVALIWFAPNHLRAFTRTAYEAIGGYDTSLFHNDDQDLMCRLYGVGEFIHVPELLYLQRMHDLNTQRDPQINANIQTLNWELYERYIQANALAWAARGDLRAVQLGEAEGPVAGYEPCVRADGERLPYADSSVGVVRAVGVLERAGDPQVLMEEIHRVLAPGGLLLSFMPSTDGRGAFQDPRNRSFWNENSLWYYTDAAHLLPPSVPGGHQARFQVSRVRTYFADQWHQDNQYPHVQANLIAIKPGDVRHGGALRV